MLNSRHSEAILSPSLSRITKRMRSSITEHFLHGMFNPALGQGKSVTHVSGTFCYLCLGTVIISCESASPALTSRYRDFHRDYIGIVTLGRRLTAETASRPQATP